MNNNKEVLVSCIVPIYKIQEEYLNRCINSLIKQTLKKIEIILIDDGSPDNCGKICDEYSIKDNRIKVIHQDNKGLAGARNSGLNIANGEYIIFVDGDDYLDENGVEKLYSYTKERGYDVIRGKFYRDYKNRTEKINFENILTDKNYQGKEDMIYLKRQVLNFNSNISSACGALYKRKLLKEYKIYNDEKLKQGSEDVEFSFRLYDYVEKAIFIDKYVYHYVYNDISISAYSTNENNNMVLECFKKILDNIKLQDEKYKNELYFQFNVRLLYAIVTTFISGYLSPKNKEKYSNKKKRMREYLDQEIVRDALKYRYIKEVDIKRRIILQLIKLKWFRLIEIFGIIRLKQKKEK